MGLVPDRLPGVELRRGPPKLNGVAGQVFRPRPAGHSPASCCWRTVTGKPHPWGADYVRTGARLAGFTVAVAEKSLKAPR
jgi:hypothetical protein